jgi:hypothetical protein
MTTISSERIRRYLEKCDPSISGEHGHNALFKAAAILTWGYALNPDEAFPYMLTFNARCVPPWSERDLKRKLSQALNHSGHTRPRGYLLGEDFDYVPIAASLSLPKPETTWPTPEPNRVDELVSRGPQLYDLWERSPVRFCDASSHAEEIVDCLFPGDPLLCIGRSNEVFATRRRETWRGRLSSLPLIVPNPMIAVVGKTQDGKPSEHTKEATARRVYLILEFDFSEDNPIWSRSIQKWRSSGIEIVDACSALILHLRERLKTLACVCFSGGKSLHAWFRVFELLESQQKDFMRYAVALGADRATYTRSQFVRIPDGWRNNGRRQICYYLDPREAVKA